MILLCFLYGLVIGSFLNVVIDRVPRSESLIKGRSYCETCHHILGWSDLIPVISFLLLRGSCRYCHKKFGTKYAFIELLTGVLFIFTYLFIFSSQSVWFPVFTFQNSIELIYYCSIISTGIAIFFIDYKHCIIPDIIVYPTTGIVLLYLILFQREIIVLNIVSALCACGFFFFLFAITKGRGMGFGDVKLAFFLGLFLGYPKIILSLYIAFLTGAVVACILIVAKRKKFHGSTIPFGPFLIFGMIVSMFYGQTILQYILSLL